MAAEAEVDEHTRLLPSDDPDSRTDHDIRASALHNGDNDEDGSNEAEGILFGLPREDSLTLMTLYAGQFFLHLGVRRSTLAS